MYCDSDEPLSNMSTWHSHRLRRVSSSSTVVPAAYTLIIARVGVDRK